MNFMMCLGLLAVLCVVPGCKIEYGTEAEFAEQDAADAAREAAKAITDGLVQEDGEFKLDSNP